MIGLFRKTKCQELGHWWNEWPKDFVVEGIKGRWQTESAYRVRDCIRCGYQDQHFLHERRVGII